MPSSSTITTDEIQDALHRAKQIAHSNPQKRPGPEDAANVFPAKRVNSADGNAQVAETATFVQTPFVAANENVRCETGEVSEIMEVPNFCVGLVIGRHGEQISFIQSQTSCRVQMSSDNGIGTMRQCTLQGSKTSIMRARTMIEDIIARADKRPLQNPGILNTGRAVLGGENYTNEMLIPATKCGLVIGKGGETIKNLQQQLGVKLLLVQENNKIGNQPKPLRISGDPSKVEYAYRFIQNMLESRGDYPASNQISEAGLQNGQYEMDGQLSLGEVIVPRSSVGIIIGKGGDTIKRLAAESGAKIQFKPDADAPTPDRCAVLQGTTAQISKATMLISELVNKSGASGGTEMFHMHVPSNKTGLVIGKGGETIKQVCAESGAHVELSRDPPPNAMEKVFVIKGTPYQIHYAQHLIRIKSGEVPPGTPLPHFCGQRDQDCFGNVYAFGIDSAPLGSQAYGIEPDLFDESKHMNPMANQWSASFGRNQMDNGQSAWQQYYTQQFNYQQGSYDPFYQQPGVQTQQTQGIPPAMNPQTGQPDYTAQWIEYYKSMGMLEEAAVIENQLKQRFTTTASMTSVHQPQYSATSTHAMSNNQAQFSFGSLPQAQLQGGLSQQQY